MARDRTHIFVRNSPEPDPYKPHPRTMIVPAPPSPDNPEGHAALLKQALESAFTAGLERRSSSGVTVAGATPGLYVVFEGQPGFGLKLESLDVQGSGIALTSVTQEDDVERAVVFIPDGKVKHFLKRFEDYATARTAKGQRKNRPLVESIADLKLATLRALWTDSASVYPEASEAIWWEIWLRETDGHEEGRLEAFAAEEGLTLGTRRLTFPDRIVVLAHGTPEQLSSSIDVLNDIAEIRRAKEAPGEFAKMSASEQREWTQELQDRIDSAGLNAPAICVLDTGVNRGHALLSGSLAEKDLHALNTTWGVHDHDGHGTEMAGLALLGDLSAPLSTTRRVPLRHRLESVKILPPKGLNPPDLYGAMTAEAVGRVEVEAPLRRRGFSLSITALDERDRGQPSSWSAAIDALAAGRSFDPTRKGLHYLNDAEEGPRRLFIVCAGNVEDTALDHIARSDLEPVHDPAQAWNALTVGAHTDLDTLDPADPSLQGWAPVAHAGDLSPYSSTSVTFAKQWPTKPDVVFEGGNKVHDGKHALQHDSLSLLTTHFKPHERPLIATWATSASTAQVSRIADLAARGAIGVFPVSGWWKDQPARDRSGLGARYALLVSIETEATDVDIYTPVANLVGVPVEVEL